MFPCWNLLSESLTHTIVDNQLNSIAFAVALTPMLAIHHLITRQVINRESGVTAQALQCTATHDTAHHISGTCRAEIDCHLSNWAHRDACILPRDVLVNADDNMRHRVDVIAINGYSSSAIRDTILSAYPYQCIVQIIWKPA